ncbi:hypothetical protein [Thalassotalea crassostreae]|uniref:hypothetical protein n=1 Tax=Thalassotalea crassostreae TaxID=1763536 RepID=UPI0012FD4374|nr:hypothetical protein [Thalassotalea crassostreae]
MKDLINEHETDTIVDSWYKQLNNAEQKLPANKVYSGDHWKVALSIMTQSIDLWVLSAGYGLIHNSSPIGSYDATFSKGSENSIDRTGLGNSEWWNSIHQSRDSNVFKTSSLKTLVTNNPNDVFFIATSPDYLKVIESELCDLVSQNKLTKSNLVIVSSKQNLNEKLIPYFLESSADFSSTLKGARVSLNIRLARYLLEHIESIGFDYNKVLEKYNHLKKISVKKMAKNRQKLTDEEIGEFIKNEINLNQQTKISATLLLNKLRNRNHACEQKRFNRLLKDIREKSLV